MIVRLAAVCMLGALACSPMDKDSGLKITLRDKVLLYSEGASREIKNADAYEKIMEEAVRLFSQADDIYLKSVSESDLERYRAGRCIEILFVQPREIQVKAIKENKEISKILIPLDEAMCKKHAHIMYGDPDYKEFNLVLNRDGCGKLKNLVEAAPR